MSALNGTNRKLTRPQGAALLTRNRDFYRIFVNALEIEFREAGEVVRGELVHAIDLDNSTSDDFLASLCSFIQFKLFGRITQGPPT